MPIRPPAETTPDLFSAPPTAPAAGPSAVPKGKALPDNLVSQPRHFLPKDLAGALKQLDDAEIDVLLAAVTSEAERRGQKPPSPAKEKPVTGAKPQPAIHKLAGRLPHLCYRMRDFSDRL